MLTNVTKTPVVRRPMFFIAPTDGATVEVNTYTELDDVTAICVHVTRITDHA